MQAHEVPDVSSYAAGFAAVGIALNGSYVLGLKKDADSGTTHRDGFRHGASDTISSAVAVGAIIAANHGYPAVDTYASLGMCASTIIFTFPTNRRIESADRVYANVQSESESAAGEESMS
jgi:Co/Zn/Cd efflux system component